MCYLQVLQEGIGVKSVWAFVVYMQKVYNPYPYIKSSIWPVCDMYQLPVMLTAFLYVAWYTLSISGHRPLSGHYEVPLFEWRR